MNETLQKFLKKLKSEINKCMKKLKDQGNIAFDSTTNHIDVILDVTQSELGQIMENLREEKSVDAEMQAVYDKFYKNNQHIVDAAEEIAYIASSLQQVYYFDKFDIVKKYLDKFNFNEIEQAEVLAVYLNIVLTFILSEEITDEQRIRDYVEERIRNEFKNLSEKTIKVAIEEQVTKTRNKILKEQENGKYLRNIISVDGNLIGHENATDFKWIFDYLHLDIKEELIDLILESSEKKYFLEEQQKANSKKEALQKEKALEESKRKLAQAELERAAANKQRKAAIQELKHYLKDGLPIRYIEESEILTIVHLLKIIGYSDEQINITLKEINANNLKLAEDYISNLNIENANKYKDYLVKNLTEEEHAVVVEASNITNSPDAIKNEFYSLILDDLIEVRTIALSTENTTFESLEYLKLYIEELKNNIEAYKMSDYRYLSDIQYKTRTKKEDEQNV